MQKIFKNLIKVIAGDGFIVPSISLSQSDNSGVELDVRGIHIEKWIDGSFHRVRESEVRRGDTIYLVADLKNTGNAVSPNFNVAWHIIKSVVRGDGT
jgi:hypothetical protein